MTSCVRETPMSCQPLSTRRVATLRDPWRRVVLLSAPNIRRPSGAFGSVTAGGTAE